jgi:hypothetical protein
MASRCRVFLCCTGSVSSNSTLINGAAAVNKARSGVAVLILILCYQCRSGDGNAQVHLTVSGCLGPCDASNVVLILCGAEQIWLSGLKERRCYEELADWATACAEAGVVLPLPSFLAAFTMQRFAAEPAQSQVT